MVDVDILEQNACTDVDIDTLVSQLNADQLRVFSTIKQHLLHQRSHELGECTCADLQPLIQFVSGVGGTGKSFTIHAIRLLVSTIWETPKSSDTGTMRCAVAAPTGLAAFNIGGVTLHRLLQIPIEHGTTASYWSLRQDALKSMKTNFTNLKLIIIDEISMVSSLNIVYSALRLNEIFGGTHWFGGINMLFVGDLLQIFPVKGGNVFSAVNKNVAASRLGSIGVHVVNVWRECVTYDELTINERQQNDHDYANLLQEVRVGQLSSRNIEILESRLITINPVDQFVELRSKDMSPICLFPTRKLCTKFNNAMLQKLDVELCNINCIDSVDETISIRKFDKAARTKLETVFNKDCNLTAGLEAELVLGVGARVMLRRNIDTESGLVNGALGTVTKIDDRCISVDFDNGNDNCKIERVLSSFVLVKNLTIKRRQYPLILAYAITIHKSQGLSLSCAIIDLTDNVFTSGMAYVALSRVTTLDGVFLTGFNHTSIFASNPCIREINRLRGIYRADLPMIEEVDERRGVSSKRTGEIDIEVDTQVNGDDAQVNGDDCTNSGPSLSKKRKFAPLITPMIVEPSCSKVVNSHANSSATVQAHTSDLRGGLVNVGNTCYINSVMQLLATTSLSQLRTRNRPVSSALRVTFHQVLQKKLPEYVPDRVLDILIPEYFDMGTQEDAAECMERLLDLYKEECPKDKANLVTEHFHVEVTGHYTCRVCMETSVVQDPPFSALYIYPGQHLTKWFDFDESVEKRCLQCGDDDEDNHTKRSVVTSVSTELVVVVRRYTQRGDVLLKNTGPVSVPESVQYGSDTYRLSAVVEHIGATLHTGHYICLLRQADGSWHTCNDDTVSLGGSPRPRNVVIILYRKAITVFHMYSSI